MQQQQQKEKKNLTKSYIAGWTSLWNITLPLHFESWHIHPESKLIVWVKICLNIFLMSFAFYNSDGFLITHKLDFLNEYLSQWKRPNKMMLYRLEQLVMSNVNVCKYTPTCKS